jgi:hypothetical protein
MKWKNLGLPLAKAIFGIVVMLLAFQFPSVTFSVLIFIFFALFAANFMFNSTHYMVWRNGKPNLVSYQRLDRKPKYVIEKESILGQIITFSGQALGYGLILMILIVLIIFLIMSGLQSLSGKSG